MKTTLTLIVCLTIGKSFGQIDTSFWNYRMQLIATSNSTASLIRIKDAINISPLLFFSQNKYALGLSVDDDMILKKSNIDELGYHHDRYQQFYKGLKVENGEYILHSKNLSVIIANGKIYKAINLSISPLISESEGLNLILQNINATKYGWEVIENDSTVWSSYPEGELLITTIKELNGNIIFKLAYKFNIMTLEPSYTYNAIYIDALTGIILEKTNLDLSCVNGNAQTLYNGSQNIDTKSRSWPFNDFLLKDECRGNGIQAFLNGNKLKDGDNQWSATSEQPATSAYWAAEKTFDFYKNTYNRNSFDNNGKFIKILTDISLNGTGLNAKYSNDVLSFGNGQNGIANHFVSLDIVGHEFTHGVTHYESGLKYQGEPGALNESFSDIFGTMVEFFAGSGNYEIGEQVVTTTDPSWTNILRRSLSNPNLFNDPDTYGGTNWIDPASSTDYGGLHTNSGVQNYWFYLLAEGGSGVNDLGNQYCVQGIGRGKAAKIAYYNLSNYLISTSKFADARTGAISAAEFLYGSNSNEVIQTTAAWYAVGVGPQYSGQFDLSDLVVSSYSAHYNSKIRAQGLTVIGGDLDVSSNTEIEILSGVDIYAGSNAAFYIAPACAGGARLANPNGISSNNSSNTQPVPVIATTTSRLNIKSNNIERVTAYPNPTTGALSITGLAQGNYSYQLINAQGAIIKQGVVTEANTNVEFSTNATNGLYVLLLYNTTNGTLHKLNVALQH